MNATIALTKLLTPARRIPAHVVAAPISLVLTLLLIVLMAKIYAFMEVPELAALYERSSVRFLLAAASSSYKEMIVVGMLSAGLAGLLSVLRTRWLRWTAIGMAMAGAVAIAVINLASAQLLRIFGAPLSAGLVYYSDVMGSEAGRVALWSWIPTGLLNLILLALLAGAMLPLLIRFILGRVPAAIEVPLLCLPALVIFGLGYARVGVGDVDPVYRKSATVAFVKSLRLIDTNLFTSVSAAKPIAPGALLPPAPRTVLAGGAQPVRNVILIVLESTSALYLDPYGGGYGATPNLDALRPDSLVVTNAYSHDVATHISMGVLFSSLHPKISLSAITSRPPPPRVKMLPRILAQRGMRTGFFYSTDLSNSGTDVFLGGSGFQTVEDFKGRHCTDALIEDTSQFQSQATTDRCTFDSLRRWIAADPAKPFFGTLWTFQSHYPYFNTGRVPTVSIGSEFSQDDWSREHKQRYLTALREADMQIGELVKDLKRRGLYDQTLIIVTGDHGESFNQHGSFGHGNGLYEQDVRVPMILINPHLSPARRFDRAAGHIDIAPTILDVLGIAPSPTWQGTSLFRPWREQPIYFFTSWLDMTVGYRLGDRKVIGHLLSDRTEIYDLKSDPGERKDLGLSQPEAKQRQAELVSWARQSNAQLDKLMQP